MRRYVKKARKHGDDKKYQKSGNRCGPRGSGFRQNVMLAYMRKGRHVLRNRPNMVSKGRCLRDTGLFACPVGMLFSDFSGADQRPRQGRSAGPDFSPMRNRGKNRLGSSPLRTSLGYEAGPASSLNSARHPCCGA